MPSSANPNRYDRVSIFLHWTIGLAILALASIQLLRSDVFPRDSAINLALKAMHPPAGSVVFALVLVRLVWRSMHPSPALPATMRSLERLAAKATHYVLYGLMLLIPATGILYTFARGRAIDFGLFQIAWPMNGLLGEAAGSIKDVHEFVGQAVLYIALVHAAAALWHHYLRQDDVLTRMLPRFLLRGRGPSRPGSVIG